MKLKVCGLTKINQIQELISLNTDFLGFIFYEKSPRFVLNHLSLEEISEINHQGKVGVFVNETIERIAEISEKAKLNFIQLHGDEDEEFVKKLRLSLSKNIKIIKVIRIGNQSFDELQKTINQQLSTKSLWAYKNGSNSRINFFEHQFFRLYFLRKITEIRPESFEFRRDFRNQSSRKSGRFCK